MLTKAQLVARLREHYPILAARYGVKRIGIFGSFAARQATETSDVDLVIEFERPIGLRFVELAEYLERVLGRPVDVLTPEGVRGIRVAHVAREIQESIEYV